jgi:pantothenate kinase
MERRDRVNDSAALGTVGADIRALLQRSPRVLVGITGPPGAGKSYFATELVAALDAEVAAYVPMDGFHLSNAQLVRLGRRDRKGAVDTFDVGGYVAALDRAADGYDATDVYVPDFDRRLDEPVAAGLVVPAAARVVVTEGNYLGLDVDGWAPVRGKLARLYYVDCPAQVRRERLIQRHMAGGRSLEEVQAWVDTVDEPNARLIAITRDRCDRVFD